MKPKLCKRIGAEQGEPAQVSPQLLGLALSNIINLMGTLQWAVRQSAETENCMTSPERLLEFAHLEQARNSSHPPDKSF